MCKGTKQQNSIGAKEQRVALVNYCRWGIEMKRDEIGSSLSCLDLVI